MLWFPFQYIHWHYGSALSSYTRIAQNVLWYVGHVFSIRLLTRSLFAPWKRRNEIYHGGGIGQYFEAIVVSVLSRVVGAIIRIPIMLTGSVVWCGTALALCAGFVMWLVAPIALAGMLISGSYVLYVSI